MYNTQVIYTINNNIIKKWKIPQFLSFTSMRLKEFYLFTFDLFHICDIISSKRPHHIHTKI